MKKNILTKAIATTLAATMVLGSSIVALADDPTSLVGEGVTEGLIDLDVVKFNVPTDNASVFNFTLDPQGLIQKSLADGGTAKAGNTLATYPTAAKVYFANKVDELPAAFFYSPAEGSDVSQTKSTIEADFETTADSEVYIYHEGRALINAGWYTTTEYSTPNNDVAALIDAEGASVILGTGDKLVWTPNGGEDATAMLTQGESDPVNIVNAGKTGETGPATFTAFYHEGQTAITAGWYKQLTPAAGETPATYEATPTATVAPALTLKKADDSAATAKEGDIITIIGKQEGDDLYSHSNTSDNIEVTNKGFVDANVSFKLAVSDLEDSTSKKAITMTSKTSTDLAALTEPSFYLAMSGKMSTKENGDENDAAAVVKAVQDADTEVKLYDTVRKNNFSDFVVAYDSVNKVYNATPNAASVSNTYLKDGYQTYIFNLTGDTNSNGWVEADYKGVAPKATVTWEFTKKSTATVALTAAGVCTVSGLSEDLTLSDLVLYAPGKGLGANSMADPENAGTFTDEVQETSEIVTFGSDWLNYYKGQTVTAIAVLSDGSTATTTATFPSN